MQTSTISGFDTSISCSHEKLTRPATEVVQSNRWRQLDLRRPQLPDVMLFQKSLSLRIARLTMTQTSSLHKLADRSDSDKADRCRVSCLTDACCFFRNCEGLRTATAFLQSFKVTNGSTLPRQPKADNCLSNPSPDRPKADHNKSSFGRASASQLGRPRMGSKRRRLTVQKALFALCS